MERNFSILIYTMVYHIQPECNEHYNAKIMAESFEVSYNKKFV